MRARWVTVPVVALTAVLVPSCFGGADLDLFFEETAEAFWAVPFECADGSVVQGTLLVRSTRDFEAPDTEDPDPTARVQFLAVCPDGISFSWAAPAARATIIGGTHEVSFDGTWTAVGPLEVTINTAGSSRKQREATATGQVVFDSEVIVNGPSNHPTRPAPFIRVDIEK